jgi:hypothetical protein
MPAGCGTSGGISYRNPTLKKVMATERVGVHDVLCSFLSLKNPTCVMGKCGRGFYAIILYSGGKK